MTKRPSFEPSLAEHSAPPEPGSRGGSSRRSEELGAKDGRALALSQPSTMAAGRN